MYYPISPVPLPVYPNGVQGAVLVVNPNNSYITVSNSSAPMSGTGVPPRGNLTWPSETPLWVYGPVGAFVDVGGAPAMYNGDIAAQFAYALGTTTITTNSTAGDEDTLRPLSQAAINSLTAADLSTPFIIYNTDTKVLNYVVNGSVVVPAGSGRIASGTYTGTGATALAVNGLGFRPDTVIIADQSNKMQIIENQMGMYFTNGSLSSVSGAAVTADGFTIGNAATNAAMNVNGTTYNWTAFKGS